MRKTVPNSRYVDVKKVYGTKLVLLITWLTLI